MSKEVCVTEEMTKKISKKNSIDKSTNVLEEKDDLSGCPGSESGPEVRGSRLWERGLIHKNHQRQHCRSLLQKLRHMCLETRSYWTRMINKLNCGHCVIMNKPESGDSGGLLDLIIILNILIIDLMFIILFVWRLFLISQICQEYFVFVRKLLFICWLEKVSEGRDRFLFFYYCNC